MFIYAIEYIIKDWEETPAILKIFGLSIAIIGMLFGILTIYAIITSDIETFFSNLMIMEI